MSSQRSRKRKKRGGRPDNYISRTVGLVLSGIQVAATMIFMIVLGILDMLPTAYFAYYYWLFVELFWQARSFRVRKES